MMERIKPKVGERTSLDALNALYSSLEELRAIIKVFDSGNELSGRTIALLCCRMIEELNLIDPAGSVPILSLSRDGSLAGGAKVFMQKCGTKTAVGFELGECFRKLPAENSLYDLSAESESEMLLRQRWNSEKILTYDKKSNGNAKSARRYDILKVTRNSFGAHFDRDIEENFFSFDRIGNFNDFMNYRQGDQEWTNPSQSHPPEFVNSLLAILSRQIATELVWTFQLSQTLSKLLNYVRPQDSPNIRISELNSMKVTTSGVEFDLKFLPSGCAYDSVSSMIAGIKSAKNGRKTITNEGTAAE